MKKVEVKFKACEHLDFSDSYAATKEPIEMSDGVKVLWNRHIADSSLPSLVQFCKHRGRLSSPVMCLCEAKKMCSDYVDFEHTVIYDDLNQ